MRPVATNEKPTNEKPTIVGIPLFDKAALLDISGAAEIFSDAGYEVYWLAPEDRPYQIGGYKRTVSFKPHHTFDNRPKLDILYFPGGVPSRMPNKGYDSAMLDDRYLNFVKEAAEETTWCGSICTGAFVLAAAGVYDNCTATTYWSLTEQLRRFPNITVPEGYPRILIDQKGDQYRFSGGGISSTIDLALALVQHISGPKIAAKAQLSAQYAPKPTINFGDPYDASQGMVEESGLVKVVRNGQQEFLIDPTAEAVSKVLEKLGLNG